METKLFRLLSGSIAVLLCAISPFASTAAVTVVQGYTILRPNHALGNTLMTATIKFDRIPAISGVDLIPAESIDLRFTDRGLPGEPPSAEFSTIVSNTVGFAFVSDFSSRWQDGVYENFGQTNGGGGAAFALVNILPAVGGFNTINFVPGGGLLSLATPNAPRYLTTVFSPALVTIIPAPAALPMLLVGLASVGATFRRKRKPL